MGLANGSLLLIGGGVTPSLGQQFIALAGGVESPFDDMVYRARS